MGKVTGSTGRFGARYGKTIRTRIIQIEKKQRKKQMCPYCNKPRAKRISMGIFTCSKCNAKFAGKAYFV